MPQVQLYVQRPQYFYIAINVAASVAALVIVHHYRTDFRPA